MLEIYNECKRTFHWNNVWKVKILKNILVCA